MHGYVQARQDKIMFMRELARVILCTRRGPQAASWMGLPKSSGDIQSSHHLHQKQNSCLGSIWLKYVTKLFLEEVRRLKTVGKRSW